MSATRSALRFRPSLSFVLLGALMAVLVLAGGASRENAAGQILVRSGAFLVLIVLFLFGRRPASANARWPFLLLMAALVLVAAQILPLPPTIWQALPGRDVVGDIAGTRVWRSWSLVPGATINALVALVIPVAVWATAATLSKDEQSWLPGLCLLAVAIEMLLGLLQFSGAVSDNPLVNDTPGVVSGTFANRNHFAVFLAIGCLIIPAWVFKDGRPLGWRGAVGLGLLLLFILMILASGSRAGMVIGGLAVLLAGGLSLRGLRSELRHAPRWVLPGVIVGVVAIVAAFFLVSVAADRAVSVQRSLSVDVEQDMRSRGFPIVWGMAQATFPVGNGTGTFDPMFRIVEPFNLLKPTFFNQAHDDYIDVLLSLGLPGLMLLGVALVWWAIASAAAWRDRTERRTMLPRLGSAMVLLVLLASVFDYPVRTPLMMSTIVLAVIWLSGPNRRNGMSALPEGDQHL